MRAIVYQPAPSAMQSAPSGQPWVYRWVPGGALAIDPLMGWTSSPSTERQERLTFPSKEAALAYAQQQGIPFVVQKPHARRRKQRSYADNFRYDKVSA